MEAAEFKQEIALLLFQAGRLTIGHASHLAQMPPNAFRELLKQRTSLCMSTMLKTFELDLKNLRELGRL
jgi:predicted HTH domain antitoxin